MRATTPRDRGAIEAFLRRDPSLHLYEIGDLDDFFFPHTTWFALEERGEILEMALLYTGLELPTLLALSRDGGAGRGRMAGLVQEILPTLPGRFYAHMSEEPAGLLGPAYHADSHGKHLKMVLTDPAAPLRVDVAATFALGTDDSEELLAFYRENYPGNWFDRRMLETGRYFGLREEGRLVAAGGVHVYSPRYRVAALGNICAARLQRGRGLGRTVTARLCRELLPQVDLIGLNVKADNAAAIACYQRLGFSETAEYEECLCERQGRSEGA
jgi:ribosomal protein S18 acetylase RimI-like enzyme